VERIRVKDMRKKKKTQDQWHILFILAKDIYAWYATEIKIYPAKCYYHRYQWQNTHFSPGVKLLPSISECQNKALGTEKLSLELSWEFLKVR